MQTLKFIPEDWPIEAEVLLSGEIKKKWPQVNSETRFLQCANNDSQVFIKRHMDQDSYTALSAAPRLTFMQKLKALFLNEDVELSRNYSLRMTKSFKREFVNMECFGCSTASFRSGPPMHFDAHLFCAYHPESDRLFYYIPKIKGWHHRF